MPDADAGCEIQFDDRAIRSIQAVKHAPSLSDWRSYSRLLGRVRRHPFAFGEPRFNQGSAQGRVVVSGRWAIEYLARKRGCYLIVVQVVWLGRSRGG